MAPSLEALVAARVLQAAGAALLVPSSLAIVLEAHHESRRQHAVALWSAVAALAAGIGPPLGGLLITASSWRLVFLVNIPVRLVAFVLVRRLVVESRAPGRRQMPDLLGGGVLALTIASLVLAVVKGQEWGWGNARVVGAFAAALLLGAYFVFRSSRQRTPVIDLTLLRIRSFALSNGVTIVMASGFYAYTLCNVLFPTGVRPARRADNARRRRPRVAWQPTTERFTGLYGCGPTHRAARLSRSCAYGAFAK